MLGAAGDGDAAGDRQAHRDRRQGRSSVSRQAARPARCQSRAVANASIEEGPNIARNATSPPATPAAFWPISTTIIEPGGMVREIANMSRNSRAVIQRCTSDRRALHVRQHRRPPPNASSESDREHACDLQQRGDHRVRSSRVSARLAGSIDQKHLQQRDAQDADTRR